jgi:putative toxin-antitoxin system antitoxin component (TIGR02293 family)
MASAAKTLPIKPLMVVLRLDLPSIESGVPISTVTDFVESSGIPLKDLYDIVIPARTLKHRRERREALTRDESDKLARVVRVFDHAVKVFENTEGARLWLSRPKDRFRGRTPLEMLPTEIGGRAVENFLGQIEYGMFA